MKEDIYESIEQIETEYTGGFADGYKAGWNDAIEKACEDIERQVSDMYGIAEEVEKLKRKD